MNEQFIILLLSIVAIVVVILIFYFNTKNQIKRLLKKIPDSSIDNLKKGKLSKITGKALHAEKPLVAPYSQRKCVFYQIEIEQEKGNDDNSYWDTLIKEEKIQNFFIEKNGDLVMIKPTIAPKNFKSYLIVDEQTSSGTFNNPSNKFAKILKRYNINSEGFLGFNKTLRCKEAIIEIGEEITVAGIANWIALDKPIEGYSYSKIATLKSSLEQELIITDLDKSNFIST